MKNSASNKQLGIRRGRRWEIDPISTYLLKALFFCVIGIVCMIAITGKLDLYMNKLNAERLAPTASAYEAAAEAGNDKIAEAINKADIDNDLYARVSDDAGDDIRIDMFTGLVWEWHGEGLFSGTWKEKLDEDGKQIVSKEWDAYKEVRGSDWDY